MNKVIIDGVDVNNCEYYNSKNKKCRTFREPECGMKFTSFKCEDDHDCYYKQLKRLRAENEKLKTDIAIYKGIIDSDKQENERLKKQYNCYACDSCGGKEDYINMKRHTENAIKTVHKYSQALQEIRDMAKEQLQDVSDRCINTTPMYIVHKHILAKINEVIGVE